MRNYSLFGLVLLSTWTFQALAGVAANYSTYPTDQEIPALPPLCKIKLRSAQSSPEFQNMLSAYGPDFIHTHHYCTGLNFINRYYATFSQQEKDFDLKSAIDNFGYMIAHAKPEFALMPDVYLNRGLVYSLMRRDAEAVVDVQKALELNPRLMKAYLTLADLYSKLKKEGKALETITEGLRQIPTSKVLKRRYDELGGKKPYPEPYADPDEKVEKTEATAKTPDDALTPASIRAKREEQAPSPSKQGETGTTPATSSNPWCRFCPEEDRSLPAPSTPAAPSTTAP